MYFEEKVKEKDNIASDKKNLKKADLVLTEVPIIVISRMAGVYELNSELV